MNSLPTLSVLMPNYNHARYLPESIGAVVAQSHQPFELIVLDDASTDNSVEVIQEFARKYSFVRLVRNEVNVGGGKSFNKLLELASGDYVCFPSADDRVLPGFFQKSIELLARFPQAGLSSAIGCLIDQDGKNRGQRAFPVIAKEPRFFSPEEVRKLLCRYGRWFEATSVIYRREALVCEGGYRQELGSFSDNFANLVIALRYGVCYLPETLSCWRQMPGGYGSRLPGGWEGFLKRGIDITHLMQTTYADLFPPAYVRKFESHWKYMVTINSTGAELKRMRQTLCALQPKLGSKPSLVNALFWNFMKALAAIQSGLWRLYAVARFAPWGWWILGRLSILRYSRRIIFSEKLET